MSWLVRWLFVLYVSSGLHRLHNLATRLIIDRRRATTPPLELMQAIKVVQTYAHLYRSDPWWLLFEATPTANRLQYAMDHNLTYNHSLDCGAYAVWLCEALRENAAQLQLILWVTKEGHYKAHYMARVQILNGRHYLLIDRSGLASLTRLVGEGTILASYVGDHRTLRMRRIR